MDYININLSAKFSQIVYIIHLYGVLFKKHYVLSKVVLIEYCILKSGCKAKKRYRKIIVYKGKQTNETKNQTNKQNNKITKQGIKNGTKINKKEDNNK